VSSHVTPDRERLAELAEEQAALRRIATLIARGVPAAQIFQAVAGEVGPLLGAETAAIQRFEPDGYVTLLGAWGKLLEAFAPGTRWKVEGDNITTLVYRTERPARFDDYQTATGPVAEEIRRTGVHSVVGSPIIVDGRLWGLLTAAASRAEPFPADAESRIAQFTELVATAISNVEARADVERLVEEQAALRRVATMVARESSAEEVFAHVAGEVGRLLGVELAATFRYDPDGAATVVGSWGDLRGAYRVGTRFPLDGPSLVALISRTARPARIDGYEHISGSIAVEARKAGLRSAVGSPIVANRHLWGVLAAGTTRADPLPEDAESRVAKFTELVATAISNVQAHSDLAASRARLVAAADEERRRVVRDLHDGAQQRLVQTVVTLKLALRALEQGRPDSAGLVGEAIQEAQTAINELRDLAHGLLPSVLSQGGLRAAVRALASGMPIPVQIDVAVERLPAAVEATAYFIVAEALTNVVKHAHARRATVHARLENHLLRLEVSDDGVGGARADGSGLVGLGDRVAALDGTIQVRSPVDGGTVIAASIPVHPEPLG
jgi:signal transduction histidine kinase